MNGAPMNFGLVLESVEVERMDSGS